MKRPRFTIAEIALFVLVLAIGLAAIRSGSDAWAGAILSVTYFTLFCSLLGIAFGRKTRRVYWLGFALLGWAYLALFLWPWPDGHIGDALWLLTCSFMLAISCTPPQPLQAVFRACRRRSWVPMRLEEDSPVLRQ